MDDNFLVFDELVYDSTEHFPPTDRGIVDVVMDTNSFKYRWFRSGVVNARPVLHLGIVNELSNHLDVFSDDDIAAFVKVLKPEVVVATVDGFNRRLIESVVKKGARKNRNRSNGQIGEVDLHTISYAIERARVGKYSLAVSDDPDVYDTIELLREKEDFVGARVACVSPRRYVLNQYSDWLSFFNCKVRNGFSIGIEEKYRII